MELLRLSRAGPSFTILVAFWQSVGVRVVKETVVPVAPGKRLGTDSQVRIGNERLPFVLVVSLLLLHGAVGTEKTAWNGHEQRDDAPSAHCFQSMVLFFDEFFLNSACHSPPRALKASQSESQYSRHINFLPSKQHRAKVKSVIFHNVFG